jgi:hypothetical protein
MGTFILQQHIIDWEVQVAFWVSLAVPFVLLTFWDWRQASYGPALVSMDWLVTLALLPSVIHRLFDVPITSPWFGWFEIVVVALIPIRSAIFVWEIYKLQAAGSEEPGTPEPVEPTEPAHNGV